MSERISSLRETMEKNEEIDTADEPEVNYRGVKAMPYIIGERLVIASYPTLFFSFSFLFLVLLKSE